MSRVWLVLMLMFSVGYSDSSKHSLGVGGAITKASTYTLKEDSMLDLTLKYDYSLFEWLDLEGRGSFYLTDGGKLYHPVTLGIFLKPNINLADWVNIYALAGYTHNTLSKQDTSATHAVTIQDDFAYGAGVEYSLLDNTSLFVDYARYVDKSSTKPEGKYAIKIDSLSLGLSYRFGGETKDREETKILVEHRYTKLPTPKPVAQTVHSTPKFGKFTIFDDMDE